MVFSEDFKQKVLGTFMYSKNFNQIKEALESNDDIIIRMFLENSLDELEINLKPRIILDEGDMLVWNSIVTQYITVGSLYSEFMEEYNQELDQYLTIN